MPFFVQRFIIYQLIRLLSPNVMQSAPPLHALFVMQVTTFLPPAPVQFFTSSPRLRNVCHIKLGLRPRTPSACLEASSATERTEFPLTSAPSPLPSISIRRICTSLWPFSRPHTIYGTLIAIISLTLLSLTQTPLSTLLPRFLTALPPALFLNVYIVGLNQYYDLAIDRVNKPYLPLPANRITKQDAAAIILTSLLLGLSFCLLPTSSTSLRIVLIGSAVLGTLYSMPPFRLKRFALLASISILVVRGLLTNLGFFLHLSQAPTLPLVVQFAAAFFTVFGIVIALLKDAPDIRGDRMFGIRTFSVRLGAPFVFRACVTVLVTMFVAAACFYWYARQSLLGGVLSVLTHLAAAATLGWRARAVDTEVSNDIYRFYMLSWKAFYLEYLLLPVAGL